MEEDSIVISGISCRLPQADNVEEFHQNMMSGKDMVTHTRSSLTDPGSKRNLVFSLSCKIHMHL